jgi:hypothetical protein
MLLLLLIFSRAKFNCYSSMDTIGIYVPAMQIREFRTFNVNIALRHGPSTKCIVSANDICSLLDIFGKNIVFFEDTFSILEGVM